MGEQSLAAGGVLVSWWMSFTMKANWQSRVSKVVCFHYSPPHLAQVTHLVFIETTFNAPSCRAVASFFHYVSTSEGQDAVFLPPSLTDMVVMSNDSCQGSEGASKWTDTGSVKAPRAKSTDNIIIRRTLYRMMRPGESMWLMHGTQHVIPHIYLRRSLRGTIVTDATWRGAVVGLCWSVIHFQFGHTQREIIAVQEVKHGPKSCLTLVCSRLGKCQLWVPEASSASNMETGLLVCARAVVQSRCQRGPGSHLKAFIFFLTVNRTETSV